MSTSHPHSSLARRRRPGTIVRWVPLLICLALCGCTRKYWRQQADDLSYDILESKFVDPNSAPARVEVRPLDPRSRFGDPYDPDCPPLPPDDPAAHEYMHWVFGMKGYKHWHEFGDTATVENPHWLEPFGLSPEVVVQNAGNNAVLPEIKQLTMVDAVQLSYIHSRDYQLQLETVYINALALTLERFAFQVQFFGLSGRAPSSDVTQQYGPANQSSITALNRVGVNQFLPTGGQWAVELANNTLWLFGLGQKQTTTSSLLSYSIVQPLLAGGGRRFALENLTQSERNVLYALRNFSRYRQGFFVSTIVGTGAVGTNFANQTASGATGTNFISSATGATIATLAGAGGGGGGNVGGYLGLLQAQQQILNQRDNIHRTEQQLLVLRAKASQRPLEIGEPLAALPEGVQFPESLRDRIRYDAEQHLLLWRGDVTDDQVAALLALSNDPAYQQAVNAVTERADAETITRDVSQLDTQLAGLRIALYTLEVNFQISFDLYKIQLGLPTDMVIGIDQAMLKPFELIDLRLVALQDRLTEFVSRLSGPDEENPKLDELRRVGDDFAVLLADLRRDGLEVTENDFQRLEQVRERRMARLETDEDRLRFTRDIERDRRLYTNLRDEFVAMEADFKTLRAALAKPEVEAEAAKQAIRGLADLREAALKTSQGLSVLQINLRVELPDLVAFDMTMPEAVGLGLHNRQDLMNARAQVMDARRKMEVAANQLQAVLNVVATGSISTPSNALGNVKPFDFRGDQSSFKAGLSFTSPIQLVVQRNNYRESMIFYEQARRNYMAVEDGVKQSIRADWRQLRMFRRQLDLARHQVRIAAVQYDQAVEATSAPVQPGQGAGNQQQGLNLLNALSAILSAQNNLINLWVLYETNRLTIYRDMGIMEIDPQGFWTDEYYQRPLREAEASGTSLYAPLAGPPPLPLPAELQEPQNGSVPPPNSDIVPGALPPVP